MALHRRAPRPLMNALAPLRDELAPQTLLARVQAVWPEVVGPVIAEQARPVSERAGTLGVACTAGVWAQELELMSVELCRRIDERLGGAGITGLRCTVRTR